MLSRYNGGGVVALLVVCTTLEPDTGILEEITRTGVEVPGEAPCWTCIVVRGEADLAETLKGCRVVRSEVRGDIALALTPDP